MTEQGYEVRDVCHGAKEDDGTLILLPCKYLPTKPGNEPPAIREALAAAADVNELIQIGFTVRASDTSPYQTAAIRGSYRGRTRAEATAAKKRDKKNKSKSPRQ